MDARKIDQKVNSEKAVFLDLDNTLYAYAPCHRYALQQAHRFYSRNIKNISFKNFQNDYAAARSSVQKRLRRQSASHSRLLYFQRMLEKYFGKSHPEMTLKLENVYWNTFFKKMRLEKWVLPLLKKWRRAGKKVVVITNLTSQIQLEKIKRLKLSPWVDWIVTSEEAGIEKPHKKIYRLAMKKAHVRMKDAVMISDDPRADKRKSLRFIKI